MAIEGSRLQHTMALPPGVQRHTMEGLHGTILLRVILAKYQTSLVQADRPEIDLACRQALMPEALYSVTQHVSIATPITPALSSGI